MRMPCCLALVPLALACEGNKEDSGDIPTADCDWFEGDNCWKDTLAPAGALLPAADAVGTFDGDARTCTYPDGLTVTLGTPFVYPIPDNHRWDIRITRGGDLVVEVVEGENGDMEVTTTAGTFASVAAGFGAEYVCPSGERWGVGLESLECDWMTLPGWSNVSSPGYLSFALSGGPEGDFHLFACSSATE